MAIVQWHPFREIESLQKEMNRLFDSFGTEDKGLFGNGSFVPSAELNETDTAIDLKVEVPGMKPDDIDLQVTADSVAISGERKSETKSEENGVTRSEFRYGSFRRVIPLPSRIQNTNVTAEYKDGILKLHLPKVEEEQNKVVRVKLN
jgi:HSP20 family protein